METCKNVQNKDNLVSVSVKRRLQTGGKMQTEVIT